METDWNSFRWQRLEVTKIQCRTFRQIPSGDSSPTNCQVVSYGCQDYNVLCQPLGLNQVTALWIFHGGKHKPSDWNPNIPAGTNQRKTEPAPHLELNGGRSWSPAMVFIKIQPTDLPWGDLFVAVGHYYYSVYIYIIMHPVCTSYITQNRTKNQTTMYVPQQL